MRNLQPFACVFALTILLLTIAQPTEAKTPTQKVKIGLAENFSVMSDATTNPYINHVRNAVQYVIQKNSDALKKKNLKVEIVQFDHQGDKIKVLEAAQNAVDSEILAVLGFYNSSEALLAAPVFTLNKILFVTPAASADRLDSLGPTVYRTCYKDQAQATALAQHARQNLKLKTAHLVSISDCAYCQSLNESFKSQFLGLGGSILSDTKLLSTQILNKTQIQKLLDKPADLVFLPNYERISATLLAQMHDAGLRPTYYMAGDGWGNTGELFYKITGDRQYKAIVTSHWHPAITSQSSKAFAKEYMAQFKREPIDTTALLADGMQFIIDVILNAKSHSRKGLLESASQIKSFKGVLGPVDYEKSHRTPAKDIPLLRYENKTVSLEKVIPAKELPTRKKEEI